MLYLSGINIHYILITKLTNTVLKFYIIFKMSDIVADFVCITNSSESIAIEYLTISDFDLPKAVQLYNTDYKASDTVNLVTDNISLEMNEPRSLLDNNINLDRESQSHSNMFTSNYTNESNNTDDALSKLYNPPSYRFRYGKLADACEKAKKMGHYVCLNILNPEIFTHQLCNRDLWSNDNVHAIIQSSFVLYQVNANTNEGLELISGYHITLGNNPYFAILDPLTRSVITTIPDEVIVIHTSNNIQINLQSFIHFILTFIDTNAMPIIPKFIETNDSNTNISRIHSTNIPHSVNTESESDAHSHKEDLSINSDLYKAEPEIQTSHKFQPDKVDINMYLNTEDSIPLKFRLPQKTLNLKLSMCIPIITLKKYLAYEAGKLIKTDNICTFQLSFPSKIIEFTDSSKDCHLAHTSIRKGDLINIIFD